MRLTHIACVLAAGLTLAGCEGVRARSLAKGDIDLVADAHIRQMRGYQDELMTKLYARNPRELAKAPGETLESRLAALRGEPPIGARELGGAAKTDAMLLAFEERYAGDRVFALMAGLVGMIRASYGDRDEFFLLSSLDEQGLYNSARNIEVLSWRLRHRLRADGKPWLVTSGSDADSGDLNLSFERTFGKMIALQDMIANIASERNQRTINRVVQGVATMVFLPVP